MLTSGPPALSRVGKYELVRKLATGGMAEVFLARFEWARGLDKTVVVKRILAHHAENPSFIELFFNEARLASRLSHPNIVQIIEFGESEGVYFLAMEYVEGLNLRAFAQAAHKRDGGIPYPYCARIVAFCCEALTHAHELVDSSTGQPLNLVHRDVSLDNILVSKTGSVKLVDFGIAKAATQTHHTETGLVRGKIPYMSPEQIRARPLDCRTDIYSLGVVFYRLIAGHKPYEASEDAALIDAILREDMVPLRTRRPDVPPDLERIVNKMLERDRDRRYANCRELHEELERYLLTSQQPVSALQIGRLVERYCSAPGRPESAPLPALATPSVPGAGKTTPGPEAPLPLTDTTGRVPGPPAGTAPLEPGRRWRSLGPAIAGAVGAMLLLGAVGVLRHPLEVREESPLPTAEISVPEAPASSVAGEPTPSPSVSPPPKPGRPAPTAIDLEVRSEPPGQVKLLRAGKPLGEGVGQVAAKVTPGPVVVEVSSEGKLVFFKRVALTIAPSPRRQAHTITVEQGTVSIRAFPSSHAEIDGGPSVGVPHKQSLYEGSHLIRFVCDRDRPCAGRAPETKKVTVHPGETADVGQIWQ